MVGRLADELVLDYPSPETEEIVVRVSAVLLSLASGEHNPFIAPPI